MSDTAHVPLFRYAPSPLIGTDLPESSASSAVPASPKAQPWQSKKAWRPTREQKRKWYGCPKDGCTASYLATLYCRLPWQWSAELTAPPGRLDEYLSEWQQSVGDWDRVSEFPGIEPPDFSIPIIASIPRKVLARTWWPEAERLQRDVARLPWDSFPFWFATRSAHTYDWDPTAKPNPDWYNPKRKQGAVVVVNPTAAEHVHMLLGGIGYHRVREILAAWPGRKKGPRPVYRVWNLLHYMVSQEDTALHKRDASCCRNLTEPPLESWNLEGVRIAHNYRSRMRRRSENRGKRRKR